MTGPSAWDTNLLSRVVPGTDAFAHVVERHRAGEPVLSTAPSLHEVVYGWSRRDDRRARAGLRVLLEAVVADVVLVLPLTAEAAILAGRLRAAGRKVPAARPGDGAPRPSAACPGGWTCSSPPRPTSTGTAWRPRTAATSSASPR